MVELVDTRDLKSLGQKWLCGVESRSRHEEADTLADGGFGNSASSLQEDI